MPYVTAAEAKTFCNVTVSTFDSLFDQLIVLASDGVDDYCGRTFSTATRTEYYSGTGRQFLLLRHRPVTSITSIYSDPKGFGGQGTDPFPSTTLLTAGVHYLLEMDSIENPAWGESGMVRWLGSSADLIGDYSSIVPGMLTPGYAALGWPRGALNLKVTYVAGYSTIPDTIKTACFLLIQKLKAQTENNEFKVTGGSIGPYSFNKGQLQYYAREVFDEVAALQRYRELVA
jgi:hypothetical protein